jgi:hypothetical protein
MGIYALLKRHMAKNSLPEGTSEEGALTLVAMGTQQGLSLEESLKYLKIIDNQITMSALIALKIAERKGFYIEKVLKADDTSFEAIYVREGRPNLTHACRVEHMVESNLINSAAWKDNPSQMLASCCHSSALRLHAADMIGVIYTLEEISDGNGVFDPYGDYKLDPDIQGDNPKTKFTSRFYSKVLSQRIDIKQPRHLPSVNLKVKLQARDLRSNRSYPVIPTLSTPLPWQSEVLVAFEAYVPQLKDSEPGLVAVAGYHVGNYKGHLCGILRQLQAPGQLFYDAQALLEGLFPEAALYYHHPTGIITSPLVTTIPGGQLGAGCILARNQTRLVYGDVPSTASNVERVTLMRRRNASVLEELGYIRT